LKSWLTRSGAACATISLLALAAWADGASSAKPAIVLVDSADRAQWQSWTQPLGWQVIAPSLPPNTALDARIDALENAVQDAVSKTTADRSRLYLVGRGDASALVFYTVSRAPDLWAAAVAVGGSPQPAIDTGRLYATNFSNVPTLWIASSQQDNELAGQLKAAGLNLEWRSAENLTPATVFDWLSRHTRDEFPQSIDCETASATFSRCYWIHLTRLDATERNDVLPSSRIEPALRPAIDLGGYGYKLDDPGPGILISFLPEKYNGPLKMGDRIIALNGRPIADAHQYVTMMAEFKEERQAVVMVLRGKEKLRLETAVVLPKRAPGVTARVQAQFDPAAHEIQILSRTVSEMQVTIPSPWTPAMLTWNGVPLEKLDAAAEPRCLTLRIEKELENVEPCHK
jgi:predicted esterase